LHDDPGHRETGEEPNMSDAPLDLQGYTLAAQKIVMYPDLNAAGRLFGGKLMGWIDEATAMTAMRVMRTRNVVTKKFGEVVFDAPGMLGDLVEIWCRPSREGRTSLTLDCRVIVRREAGDRQISRSNVVYVALDDAGLPRPWKC
jgi:acyl-CoA hydrolase